MEFLSTPADIAIYGGAAGGGKSYGLLLDPLRHYFNPKFGGVIFRRTTTQVRNEGGMWDDSMTLYPHFRARPKESTLEWIFPHPTKVGYPGARLKFAHLEHDKTVLDWQGSQIAFQGYDELTHFSEYQFFYMMSRNRSSSGVPGYIRATCNPDPDSWVRKFIDWWIGPDGYPIYERSGKLRWFIRQDDRLIWGDSKEELYLKYGRGPEIQPKSVTFIPSKVYDNKILLTKDPSYLSNLLALSKVERLRLLGGNWNIRASAGNIFQRAWFPIIETLPAGYRKVVRYWDRAATKPSETNRDPDWTRGLKLYQYLDGSWVVGDLRSMRDGPGQVENLVLTTAQHDGHTVEVWVEQDPGSAGVADVARMVKVLQGFPVKIAKPTKDKLTRAKPVSSQAEARNIRLIRAPWNDDFLTELENFPEGAHDDIVDTFSGAFNEMSRSSSIFDAL